MKDLDRGQSKQSDPEHGKRLFMLRNMKNNNKRTDDKELSGHIAFVDLNYLSEVRKLKGKETHTHFNNS